MASSCQHAVGAGWTNRRHAERGFFLGSRRATPASRKIRASDAIDGTTSRPNARILSCTLIGRRSGSGGSPRRRAGGCERPSIRDRARHCTRPGRAPLHAVRVPRRPGPDPGRALPLPRVHHPGAVLRPRPRRPVRPRQPRRRRPHRRREPGVPVPLAPPHEDRGPLAGADGPRRHPALDRPRRTRPHQHPNGMPGPAQAPERVLGWATAGHRPAPSSAATPTTTSHPTTTPRTGGPLTAAGPTTPGPTRPGQPRARDQPHRPRATGYCGPRDRTGHGGAADGAARRGRRRRAATVLRRAVRGR